MVLEQCWPELKATDEAVPIMCQVLRYKPSHFSRGEADAGSLLDREKLRQSLQLWSNRNADIKRITAVRPGLSDINNKTTVLLEKRASEVERILDPDSSYW